MFIYIFLKSKSLCVHLSYYYNRLENVLFPINKLDNSNISFAPNCCNFDEMSKIQILVLTKNR